jgi:hypothetical protein
MRKQEKNSAQLSLFDDQEKVETTEPTVLQFIRARFEHGPEMTQEEYKRWIKILINHSLKRMEP